MSWAHFDPWASRSTDELEAWFAWLRAEAPVHRLPDQDIWVASRYADVVAALRDHRRFSSWSGNDRNWRHVDALPSLDPPEHTRARRRVSPVFSSAAMARWRPLAADAVHHAIEALPRRSFDAVATVARTVPTAVLAAMLDVEPRVLRSLADRPGSHRHAVLGRVVEQRAEELAAGRRAPDADAISMALGDVDDLDAAIPEVVSFVVLLLAAGIDTVRDLLAEAFHLAATSPETVGALTAGRDTRAAGDELLRWFAPLQATFRSTTEPVELGGTTIPAGVKVMLALGSANRDTAWWDQADSFAGRAARHGPPTPHVALGAGVHRCLGAPLAHVYAAAVVEALGDVELEVAGDAVRRRNPAVRSFDLLRLRQASHHPVRGHDDTRPITRPS